MRRLTALVALALLAGCGLNPGVQGTALTRVTAAGDPRFERDLGGDVQRESMLLARLAQEAIGGQGQQLIFPTRTTPTRGLGRRAEGTGFVVRGRLQATNLAGQLADVPLATAWLTVDGKRVTSVMTQADGSWTGKLDAGAQGKPVGVQYQLANDRWSVRDDRFVGGTVASLTQDTDLGTSRLEAGTAHAQSFWIHEIYLRALASFTREGIDLGWWQHRIATYWPEQGNYYQFDAVHLSDPDHWDVNGHEIGHALHDQGINGRMGGGQHYIDRCYESNLAWSEGFASFFSGVISLSPDDPDARFQFMVPRRAPIRLENVPADVCAGPTNEWWTAAALWDLYDTHADGQDQVAVSFATIWGSLAKNNGKPAVGSVVDAYQLLKLRVPADQAEALRLAMLQNQMLPGLLATRR